MDGVELAWTTVTVTTLGTELLRDVAGLVCAGRLSGYPGEKLSLERQQGAALSLRTGPGSTETSASPAGPRTLPGVLENPAPASFQSGIGVLSGWVCEAEEVVIEIDEIPLEAAYHEPGRYGGRVWRHG